MMDSLSTTDTSSTSSSSNNNKDGTNISVTKKDLADPSVQKNISKMKGANVSIVDEAINDTKAPSKLSYLSNMKDIDGNVSEPFELNGKKYQMVRAMDENKQKVKGVYCLDELNEGGENTIYTVEDFEKNFAKKSEVAKPELTEKESHKSLNLGTFKYFLIDKKTNKVRKFKTAEELAKAGMTADEKYMNLSDFRKHVNGTLFGSKKPKELTEDDSPDGLHAKAIKLMSLISTKIPSSVIDSIKKNKLAQKEVIVAFANLVGVPTNLLPQIINDIKSISKSEVTSVTSNDGNSELTFENAISKKTILKTIKVKDLKNKI